MQIYDEENKRIIVLQERKALDDWDKDRRRKSAIVKARGKLARAKA